MTVVALRAPGSAFATTPRMARTALRAAAWAAALGAVSCVDSSKATDAGVTTGRTDSGASDATTSVDAATGGMTAVMCEAVAPVAYAGAAAIPTDDTAAPGPYAWKNVVIKGGGFVSGIVTSSVLPGLVFARTDVGGAYRAEPIGKRWLPVTDWVGHNDSNLTGIESIALDPVDPNRIYLAAGQYLTAGNGVILRSSDMGRTWSRASIAAPMGGNADGRSMGERLAVDPNLPSVLYFGSRNTGLWKSTDAAVTWTRVAAFPVTGSSGADGSAGFGLSFVLFDPASGSAGAATPLIYVGVGVTNGPALYRSADAGMTWEAVPAQPAGMMPHHAVLDGCGNLYLAYNNGPGPNGITAGAVWRHTPANNAWTDVSPPRKGGGFGGIAADAVHPGTLLVTTIDLWAPDEIYRTTNGGRSWVALGAAAQRDGAGAAWLWWHGARPTATGWMGDIEIDPFDPGHALYITGQGIWSSRDVTAADARAAAPTHWIFDNDGLEETVVLDLVSPPAGAPLLSAVGDIAGFRHADLSVSPPGGMFDNPVFGNTTSLDFAEAVPQLVARVGTASGNGKRGALSSDGGATWKPFAAEPSGSTGSGSIAVSADGATLLWAPQGGTPALSRDKGATWIACSGLTAGARVAADRSNPSKFYASTRNRMYASSDGGATFTQATSSGAGRPRPVFGVEGEVWVATSAGLLRSQDGGATYKSVTGVSAATAVGFGMAAPDQTYPAVYLAGAVAGTWGTYRSDDAGATWQRIDDPQHQFGYLNCLTGDPRRFGRVYLGTGGRGIVTGDPR